jgi:hypothetical protein
MKMKDGSFVTSGSGSGMRRLSTTTASLKNGISSGLSNVKANINMAAVANVAKATANMGASGKDKVEANIGKINRNMQHNINKGIKVAGSTAARIRTKAADSIQAIPGIPVGGQINRSTGLYNSDNWKRAATEAPLGFSSANYAGDGLNKSGGFNDSPFEKEPDSFGTIFSAPYSAKELQSRGKIVYFEGSEWEVQYVNSKGLLDLRRADGEKVYGVIPHLVQDLDRGRQQSAQGVAPPPAVPLDLMNTVVSGINSSNTSLSPVPSPFFSPAGMVPQKQQQQHQAQRSSSSIFDLNDVDFSSNSGHAVSTGLCTGLDGGAMNPNAAWSGQPQHPPPQPQLPVAEETDCWTHGLVDLDLS